MENNKQSKPTWSEMMKRKLKPESSSPLPLNPSPSLPPPSSTTPPSSSILLPPSDSIPPLDSSSIPQPPPSSNLAPPNPSPPSNPPLPTPSNPASSSLPAQWEEKKEEPKFWSREEHEWPKLGEKQLKKPQFINNQRSFSKIEMTPQLIREISQYDLESLKEFVLTLFDSKMVYQNQENFCADLLDIFRAFIKKKKEEHSEVLAILFQTELVKSTLIEILKLSKSRPSADISSSPPPPSSSVVPSSSIPPSFIPPPSSSLQPNSSLPPPSSSPASSSFPPPSEDPSALSSESLSMTPPKFESLVKIIRCIYDFAIYLLDFENDNLKFLPLNQTIESLEMLLNQRGTEELENLYKDFHTLRQDYAKKSKMLLLENKSRSTFLQFDFLVCSAKDTPITYKEDSATPTLEDLFKNEEREKFFPHVVSGEYNSWQQYFNNMFYMLKEDFLEGLRKSLQSYISSPLPTLSGAFFESVYLYTSPYINKVNLDERDMTYHLIMTPYKERKKQNLNWMSTKRLIYGTLLLICEKRMKKICFASVCCKPEASKLQELYEEHNKILLSIKAVDDRTEELEWMFRDYDKDELIVLECKAYFESYYHFLNKLKGMNTKNLPFEEYIVGRREGGVRPPSYLKGDYKYIVEIEKGKRMIVDMEEEGGEMKEEEQEGRRKEDERNRTEEGDGRKREEEERRREDGRYREEEGRRREEEERRREEVEGWRRGEGEAGKKPSIYDYLDESQFKALKNILTKEISIIQGPPGTGKTYVGAQAVKILLQNKFKWNSTSYNKPLLIVAYTNHALDQFLAHILKFTNKIVRIGGRCSNPELTPYMLRNLRKGKPLPPVDDLSIGAVMKMWRQAKAKIEKASSSLKKGISYSTFVQTLKKETHYDFPRKFDYELSFLFKKFGFSIQQEVPERTKAELFRIWLDNLPITSSEVYKIVQKTFNKFSVTRDFKNKNDVSMGSVGGKFSGRDENVLGGSSATLYNRREEFSSELHGAPQNSCFDDNASEYSEEDPFFEENKRIELNETELTNYSITAPALDFPSFDGQDLDFLWKNDFFIDVDVWELHPKDRKLLYFFCVFTSMKDDLGGHGVWVREYKKVVKMVQRSFLGCDLEICKEAEVIGMTINGCAKFSEHLENFGSPITLIEEAGEVLEAHNLCALTPHLKHLIMIGDHQQLRPSVESYTLESHYNFAISLFERLIIKGVPYVTLERQRRMRPDFADFIRIIYGDEYKDHESIMTYSNVKGVVRSISNNEKEALHKVEGKVMKETEACNLFFFNHDWMENEMPGGSKSKSNEQEALFVAAFANYLIMQGYNPAEITILSMYVGQTLKIKHVLKKKYNVTELRVATVDNYQGEENEIIILSMVRSNKKNILGFTSIENRICVALSRAKIGLFVMGNFDCLCKGRKTDLWLKIVNTAKSKGAYGNSLSLACQNHGKARSVSSERDFEKIGMGGCVEVCRGTKECGHICDLICHNYVKEKHSRAICELPCQKKLPCGHDCLNKCKDPCGPCLMPVTKILPCSHSSSLHPCHIPFSSLLCSFPCPKTLPCGHHCALPCGQPCQSQNCKETVMKELPCGHQMPIPCGVSRNKVKCSKKCTVQLKCGHTCAGDCYKCVMFSLHKPCRLKIEGFCTCGRMKYNGYCGEPRTFCPKCQPPAEIMKREEETGGRREERGGRREDEGGRREERGGRREDEGGRREEGRRDEGRREENKWEEGKKREGGKREGGGGWRDAGRREEGRRDEGGRRREEGGIYMLYQEGVDKIDELRRSMRRMHVNYKSSILGDIYFVNQIENIEGLYFNRLENDADEEKYREVVGRLDALLEYRDAYFNNMRKEERDEMMDRILQGREEVKKFK